MIKHKNLSKIGMAVAAMVLATSANAVVSDTIVFRTAPMVIVWGANNPAQTSPTSAPVVSDLLLLGGTSNTVATDIIAGDVTPFVTGTVATNWTHVPVNTSINGTESGLISVQGSVAPLSTGVTDNGTIAGVLDAGDTMGAFGISTSSNLTFADSLVKRSFFVASNAPFKIFAKSETPTRTGSFLTDNVTGSAISWNMAVTTTNGSQFGTSAQDPGSEFAYGTGTNLGTFLAAPVQVYNATRRTAASEGSIMAQSVRFDITYAFGTDAAISKYDFSRGVGSIAVPVTYTVYNP